jgi:hypothetical protein
MKNSERGGYIVEFMLIQQWICDFYENPLITLHWKAHQFKSKAQPGSLSCSNTDGGRDSVKDGKDDGGEDGEGGNLIQRQSALWDEDGGSGDNETFDQILNDAVDNFGKSVAHHDSIFRRKKKTHIVRK